MTTKPPAPARVSPLEVRMEDVAMRAQVSRATVSRVIMGTAKVSDATRERVHDAMRELGYVPNKIAQGLAGRGTDLVGLLLRDPRNPAYGELHAQMQSASSQAGLQLISAVPSPMVGAEDELSGLRRMLGLRVGGLFVATGVIAARDLEPFLDAVPVVAVGRVEEHPGIYGVSYDEDYNAAVVAGEVVALGHRRACVVIPDLSVSLAENRRGLALAANLTARGVTVDRIAAKRFGAVDDGYERAAALARAGEASVVLFTSDWRALGFLEFALDDGLDVPGEISVTGMDGATPGLRHIGLATLRIPIDQVARRAVAVMTEMLSDRAAVEIGHERFGGEFVPGRTLAAPAGRFA